MATKQQALKAIEIAGVTLDQDMADSDNFTLDAPAGYVFAANNEPSYCAGHYDREEVQFGGPRRSDIYADIVMACRMGIYAGEGSE